MEETTTKNPIQVKFFEKIKQSLPQNLSLANEVAEILEISTDGAYRRMRGETVLSIDEVVKLCSRYRISPDIIGSADDNSATFHYKNLISNEGGFQEYMKGILTDLKRINASNPKQVIYSAQDIPVFHYFYSPLHTAFKILYWEKAVLCLPSTEGKLFDPATINADLMNTCRQITENYVQIPSIEIWYRDTMLGTLRTIEYAWESGWFKSKEDAHKVVEQVGEIMTIISKQASRQAKFMKEEKWAENEGNFTMYQSEVEIVNNNILVTAGSAKALYLTHNSLNSLMTSSTAFCNETEAWLKNLMKKSIQISGIAEKQRHIFFTKCQEKVQESQNRIAAQ